MSIPVSGTTEAVAPLEATAAPEGLRPGIVSSLLRHPSAIAGLSVLAFYLLTTLLGPLLLHGNPTNDFNYQNLHDAFEGPSRAHLLGTDQLGRDELVRLLYGARFTLLIAV